MQIVIEWVTNIIIFILFAMIIDLLLPSSNMQKYVKMVVGLILLLLMLSPMLKLFSIDPDRLIASAISDEGNQQEMMKNEIEMKKKEIQASQRAYILEQMAVQMKNEADEELMEKYGLSVENVSLQTKEKENLQIPEDIEMIEVMLAKQEKLGEVQPVIIDASTPTDEQDHDQRLEKEIRAWLATKWEIHENKIAVQIKGREWGDARLH
ncbi:stage III sporulation protein AF [Parageobacillus thermoglucosidasius]|uniref:stage III sporulation protein AF n=1 Tax=Parageobacillus thermoglucosidasius TaxID=1426 RepID=UPI001FCC0A51|nr:stage III sporulation protein AF [Parageobacillus thermoglucosidasius]MED4905194.1 stage III sporulation protein AF [Parageobacillus thermoglucosidasius]MED4913419.1 stage III sporulation protein AF [Parageobacillus thermoglucosidasius]MED4944542.1 stage III sporulation protein AF [Parageobacillus thermoglucosidasius]MED4984591.1 stage III sporulation protein AF [Parageobacillus thermoglucosidasius]BDG31412.1 stage III sporulation protein AF [Parageobacillus thermoglucosidasius]